MSSRNAYAALTPDYSDFALPHTNTTGAASSSAISDPSTSPGDLTENEGKPTGRWRARYLAVKGMVQNNAGLLLITASQAFFSSMNTAVKNLNSIDPPIPTLELVAVRMGITYLCSISYMLYAKVPDPWLGPKGVRLLLVFRGFSGFFGLFGIYYSLQYLSLSDATVLTFLAPLCTGIAGAIFLKENFTKTQALASVCSLFGVVLIARPVFLFGHHSRPAPKAFAINRTEYLQARQLVPGPSEKGTPEERLIAVGVALIGVLGATGAYTSITAIGKRAHPLHAMTSFSIQCVTIATIAMLVQGTTFVIPTRLEWLALLLMVGIFGFIAQILLTMGLQRETAGRGSTAIYTQVVFAAVLERLFFKTVPSILSVVGTLIIISSALYVAMTKDRAKTKPDVVRLGGVPDEALEEGLLENNPDDEDIKGKTKEEEPIPTPDRQKSLSRTRSDSRIDEMTIPPSFLDKGKETST